MRGSESPLIDVGALLEKVEAAAPIDAVEAALADSADLHPREVVHVLGAAVLDATGGDLRDDATMVRLDWYGGPPRGWNTERGADPDRASAALLPVRAG
jgi:hypothetical protein